jgi:ribosomal protein S18 acetylase RimI-like enzyme
MTDQNAQILHKKVVIRRLTREFAKDLNKQGKGYFSDKGVLAQGIRHEILKAIGLSPRSMRLVAFHTEEKRPIGFLCLEENTNWLFTIKFVFVNPMYRNKGVATRLVNYAITIAKEKGAKKVNLNAWPPKTKTINLYRKIGFKELGTTILVQGYLSKNSRFESGKRTVRGLVFLTKFKLRKEIKLFQPEINSKKTREEIFSLYRRCVNNDWLEFFEVNANNLINGSRHIWQPPFFKHLLINNVTNSFALIFNRPFSQKATVELYSTSQAVVPSMLEDLREILSKRGIFIVKITLFNDIDSLTSNWIVQNNMKTFQYASMGKVL